MLKNGVEGGESGFIQFVCGLRGKVIGKCNT